MGDPVKLECRICGESYFLHPSGHEPIEDADLCVTCATFKEGMRGWQEEETMDNVKFGILVCALSGLCVLLVIVWALWRG